MERYFGVMKAALVEEAVVVTRRPAVRRPGPVRRTAGYRSDASVPEGEPLSGDAATQAEHLAANTREYEPAWFSQTARLSAIEDYTNKYKGEQVEIALFGGEYQDGVLTAYCYLEDVAHVELNGHILIPLQNVASLHCSSRCDAPEPDWPPRGLAEEDGADEP
jgi:hypothetical protein